MLNDIRSERDIERDFLIKLAQEIPAEIPDAGGAGDYAAGDEGGALGGTSGLGAGDLDETLAPSEPGQGEEGLPDIDTDATEMQAVKDLIPWDSFVILMDPHYAKLLQDSLSLPEPKAKSKSFYIYFSPENKRVEGIVNKRYVGGYGQKEQLGEDLAYLKTLSAEGFSPDWKDKLLSDIDELPAVENSNIKEELREKQKESEEKAEKEEDEVMGEAPTDKIISDTEAPEESSEAAAAEGEDEEGQNQEDEDLSLPKKKKKSPPVAKPEPVGKVDTTQLAASLKDVRLKRLARLNKINKMKD